MARAKLTKNLAKRVDGSYIDRPHSLRRLRRAMLWLAGAIAAAWLALVSFRVAGGRIEPVDLVYNPGPVSTAHANIQNDCRACHAGTDSNGFLRSVTDQACLVCHDGAIHADTQRIARNAGDVSRASHTLAMTDESHPHGARSAACASCHVEHRDRVALAATSDAHCHTCHADLPASLAPGATLAVQPRILSFRESDHPRFGRRLMHEGKLTDPTQVQFNHQYHLTSTELKASLENGTACQTCHRPYELDRRYMQPVTYEQHCRACHELKLTPEITLAHEEMPIVRAQLLSLPELYRLHLLAMTPAQRQATLVEQVPASRRQRATTRPIDQTRWIAKQLTKLADEVEATLEDARVQTQPSHAPLMRAVPEPTTQFAGASAPVAETLEFHVAYGITNHCAKCHTMNDGLTPDAAAQAPSSTLLATLPTGITEHPRRWFVASRFDHDAHRNLDCLSCHAPAVMSELTSDILSPDIDTRFGNQGKSCVDCHHPSTTASPAAPAGCVTCHDYHDRTRERPWLTSPPER